MKDKKWMGYLEYLTPVLDWHLNHKVGLSEHGYWIDSGHLVLEFYCIESCDNKLIYTFKLLGDKPQIIFKKGRRNWHKIDDLQDLEFVSLIESENV